jgi:hypothetical protein
MQVQGSAVRIATHDVDVADRIAVNRCTGGSSTLVLGVGVRTIIC